MSTIWLVLYKTQLRVEQSLFGSKELADQRVENIIQEMAEMYGQNELEYEYPKESVTDIKVYDDYGQGLVDHWHIELQEVTLKLNAAEGPICELPPLAISLFLN